MKNIEIIKYPDERLSQTSTNVETIEEGRTIALNLIKAMSETNWGRCVGMAAPQIGISKNVFVALDEVFINSEILWTPKGGEFFEKEGCYSLEQGKEYLISRPYAVKIKYQNMEGEWQEKRFNDLKARVILHETDHILGKLCCEYI